MDDIKKIKRTALVVFCVTCASLLYYIWSTTYGTIIMLMPAARALWNAPIVATVVIVALMVISTFVVFTSLITSLTLLRSIRKSETPFNFKSVNRLKIIAITLILVEVFSFLLEYILMRVNPLSLEMQSWSTHGGFIVVAGLIIYCVALVFQYGISLQTQVDETL